MQTWNMEHCWALLSVIAIIFCLTYIGLHTGKVHVDLRKNCYQDTMLAWYLASGTQDYSEQRRKFIPYYHGIVLWPR